MLGEAGELLGIVTDRDICIALGTRNVRPSDLHVADVVQNHLAVCRTTDDVHTALQDMRLRKVRRLPVLGEDSRVEGILSMDDVVLAAERDGGMGSGISYGDAITTLKLIYQKGDGVVV